MLKAKIKIVDLLGFVYWKIFGVAADEKLQDFFRKLSWSFAGGIIASGLVFFMHILAGRALGPEEYGKASLVLAGAQFLFVALIFGTDIASSRELAKAEAKEQRSSLISTALAGALIFGASISLTLLFFREKIADIFALDSQLVSIAIALSFVLGIKFLLENFFRGLHFFQWQSLFKISESMVALGVLLLFLWMFGINTFLALVAAIFLGSVILIILYLFKIAPFIKIKQFKSAIAARLFRYGRLVVANAFLSAVFLLGDKIIINKYLGAYDLGIYAAYSAVSVMFMSLLATIVVNVFFVFVSGSNQKKMIAGKIDELFKKGFLPAIVLLAVFIFIMMKFFGSQYLVEFKTVAMFSFLGCLLFFSCLYAPIVNTYSNKIYFYGLFSLGVRALLFVAHIGLLLHFNIFSLTAILLGLIGNYIADIIASRMIIYKFIHE